MLGKIEIIKAVSGATGFTKKDVGNVFDAFVEFIANSIEHGESVRVPGLGTFSLGDVAERNGRNPQTGEVLVIPAHRAPKFKFAQALKDAVK